MNATQISKGATVAMGMALLAHVLYAAPHGWGLYDTSGNTWEWCRDDNSRSNLSSASDPFTPAYAAGTANRIMRGGGGFNSKALAGDEFQFRSSWRGNQPPTNTGDNRGFRVAWIRQ